MAGGPVLRSLSEQPTSEEILMSTAAISSSSIYQQTEQYFQTRQSDLQQLAQALRSGDLAGAQTAFNTLQSTFQRAAGAQNPPSASANSGPEIILNLTYNSGSTSAASSAPTPNNGPEIILNLNNIAGNTSPEQITIDINNSANGGGEQVSLSFGNPGFKEQQITFNLSPNSNEQIVLNLLGDSSPTGSSPSSASPNGGLNVS